MSDDLDGILTDAEDRRDEDVIALVDEVRRLRRLREAWIAACGRADGLAEALSIIWHTHRPLDADDRLCAEGCHGAWPCTTRLETAEALGLPRDARR